MEAFKAIVLVIWIISFAVFVWLVIQIYKATKTERSSEEYVIKGWIARDKDGALWLYAQKPYRSGDMWNYDGPDFMRINPRLLPSLRWEDEPIQAKLVKNKEYGKRKIDAKLVKKK